MNERCRFEVQSNGSTSRRTFCYIFAKSPCRKLLNVCWKSRCRIEAAQNRISHSNGILICSTYPVIWSSIVGPRCSRCFWRQRETPWLNESDCVEYYRSLGTEKTMTPHGCYRRRRIWTGSSSYVHLMRVGGSEKKKQWEPWFTCNLINYWRCRSRLFAAGRLIYWLKTTRSSIIKYSVQSTISIVNNWGGFGADWKLSYTWMISHVSRAPFGYFYHITSPIIRVIQLNYSANMQ